MILHWPQITMIVLIACRVGGSMAGWCHDEKKSFAYLAGQLTVPVFMIFVLFKGGFFG